MTNEQSPVTGGDGLRILHLVDGLRVGGAEKLIVTFARELRHHPDHLTIVSLQRNVPAMRTAVEAAGAQVIPIHSKKLINPRRFQKLWQLVRREQFAVIHTHLTAANILGGFVGRLTGTPVVTTLHNTRLISQQHFYHGRLENWVLTHLTTQVIGVGWQVAATHQARLGLDNIMVLPNAVALPPPLMAVERARVRASLVDDPEAVILLAVGRLRPQKGFLDLLTAFAQVHQNNPCTRLLIAGKGEEADVLSAKIAELGLEQSARLLGLRHDVPDLLGASDIYVSAAHWEGLPISMLEAMAAGRPCVVTAVGDVSRVMDESMGVVLPPRQPQLLADALQRLIEAPESWPVLGAAARQKVAAAYSADVWTEKQLALYRELAREKRPPVTAVHS
ncbi:MAG: glycosyltransferase [Anaerolineales bacterium]|nr:glycosyltransferase [Anaerolineales bacterium]